MAREGRSTVYNRITTPEKLSLVNPINIELENDFLAFLYASDKSEGTITQYKANLHIFWCWNLDYNNNKSWIDVKKRELLRWQNYCLNDCGWSPKRLRTFKSTLSSLSTYIVEYMDDEYPDYMPVIDKIKNPTNVAVRKKTVYTDEELQMILDYFVEHKKYMQACLFALAMYSGRRKSELARFKASYFKDEHTICEGALYESPEEIVTKGAGKRGKLLTVYVLAHPFKPYLDLWLKEREELGITSDWLFPRMKDGVWTDEQITKSCLSSMAKSFDKVSMELIGKPYYHHALRHYFTTKLSQSNIPPNVIQNLIGWESAEMVSLYDDSPKSSQFDKYFGAEGIKEVTQASLRDL